MINSISSYDVQNQQGAVQAARASQTSSAQQDKPASSEKNSQSVKVTLSDEALKKLGLQQQTQQTPSGQSSEIEAGLTEEELREVADLKARDREVRAHEMAHVSAGGSIVRRGATYTYEKGPDGLRYAVGGEVSIDTSAVQGDPEATISKMQQVKRAALAPAEPSSQDRQVAASASRKESAARSEMMAENMQDVQA